MGLGGGSFTSTDKILPGSYINFISSVGADEVFANRGVVAMPLVLDWGIDGQVIEVSANTFQSQAKGIFGYSYLDDKLKGIADLFKNASKAYFYRLVKSGVKATNTFGSATCFGLRGNDITIIISINVEDAGKMDVSTLLDGENVDGQTVASASELVDNDFVVFDTGATLAQTAGLAMSGGSNGDTVTGAEYSAFLAMIEPYRFNVLGCLALDDTIKDLFVAFTKRMRDDNGIKFQTVVYKRESSDYEGIISIDNETLTSGALASSLVYWTAGVIAGVLINQSVTNKAYDGQFEVDINYTIDALEGAVAAGKFIFHRVGNEVRVLTDINTLLTFSAEKTKDFSKNQTIRCIDQVGNDIAYLTQSIWA